MKPLIYQPPYDKFSIIKLYSKRRFLVFIQLIMLISLPLFSRGQRIIADSIFIPQDTLEFTTDTTSLNDTLNKTDSVQTASSIISKDAVESKVHYKARDSTRFDLEEQKLYLFGDAEVYYEQVILKAALIEVDLDSNLVYARGVTDSLGNPVGTPVFKDGDQEFSSYKMTYNFRTKKGKINEVITQEGEGYIHGKDVKKTGGDVIYIKDGKYTTCNLPHPHFSLSSRKLKVIPGKKIITGPAVLVIEDVPTPLGVPFGIFPNSGDRSSGVLIPAPGESTEQGFFLQNGGYYFGFSDKIDLALRGDIYSKGSYGLYAITNYRNRYRFHGNMQISRSVTKTGVIREDPAYSESRNFFINWLHSQDPKARPNSRFSANVNAGTRSNFRNNLNTTTTDYLSNTFNSNINYTKSFPGKPFTLSLAARHSQNSNTGIVNLTLPEAAFTVQRIYLPGSLKKVGISSTLNAKNEINVHDSLISMNNLPELSRDFRYGVRNTIPISTSMKVMKYFSLNPSFTTNQILYFETIRKSWDPVDSVVAIEEVKEVEAIASYSPSVALSTILYGLFQFRKGKIQAIRHKMTPSIGYIYTPENRSGLATYIDTAGRAVEYSIFEQGVYGTLNSREAQSISLSLQNNLEMKVRSASDTGEVVKKLKIFENLAFSTFYNATADSLNWAPVNISGWTTLWKNISLNFGGNLDLYSIDSAGNRYNSFYWDEQNSPGRLTNAFVALGISLRSPLGEQNASVNPGQNLVYEPYIDFDVPWNLNINYKMNYSKPAYEENLNQTLNFSGDLSLTDKWKVGFTSGYDFDAKDLTYTTLNIYRDLHCWEMSMMWIPSGIRQSYTFTIKVKASVLQDLKMEKKNLPQSQF